MPIARESSPAASPRTGPARPARRWERAGGRSPPEDPALDAAPVAARIISRSDNIDLLGDAVRDGRPCERKGMMKNPVGWFEIYVQDMDRAKAFYQAVFGAQFTRLESPEIEMWGFPMESNGMGASGSLVKMPGFPPGGTNNSVLVYFMCDDCAVEADKAVAAGGRLQKAKMSIGQYGHIALVIDTEGNMIGLHSMQ
jgi:predicted enzyme related to lactoylglutathione lyase